MLTEAARSCRAAVLSASSPPASADAASTPDERAFTAIVAEGCGSPGTTAKASKAAHPMSPPQLALGATEGTTRRCTEARRALSKPVAEACAKG